MSSTSKRFCPPNRSVTRRLSMRSDEDTAMDYESPSDVTNTDSETYHDHSFQQETNSSLEVDSKAENFSSPSASNNDVPIGNVVDFQGTKLTDLSNDVIREIFDYLPLGEIYRGFYHLNQSYKKLIDCSFPTLNLTSMSYNQFMFYLDSILPNNDYHYEHVVSLTLSNRKPMNQIDIVFAYLDSYSYLERLCLHSPTDVQLQLLSLYANNLSELYVIRGDYISSNNCHDNNYADMKWLSGLTNLKKCSIDCEVGGGEIDTSMKPLSRMLSSLSITLSSTHDFYALLERLPIKSIRHLHVRLFDSVFYYFKDHRYSLSSSTILSKLSFDMFSVPLSDVTSLYNMIQFVSNTSRHVETLAIRCRLADGLVVDESRLRNSLSFLYSMKTFHFYLEMNNLVEETDKRFTSFNETDFRYPFWTDKRVHINVYRTLDKTRIERVKIYTLPLQLQMINSVDEGKTIYKSSKSAFANIHLYIRDCSQSPEFDIFDDATLTSAQIRTSSNITLLPYLSRVSSLQMTDQELWKLSTTCFQMPFAKKIFPNIRHVYINRLCSGIPMSSIRILPTLFPRLQSFCIGYMDSFDMLQNVLLIFLAFSSSKQTIVHLSVSVFDLLTVFWRHADQQQLMNDLEASVPALRERTSSYKPWYDPRKRQLDIWL